MLQDTLLHSGSLGEPFRTAQNSSYEQSRMKAAHFRMTDDSFIRHAGLHPRPHYTGTAEESGTILLYGSPSNRELDRTD